MPTLIVRDGPSAGGRIEFAAEVVLGRANDMLRTDAEVSERHAAVRSAAGELTVEDLGSSNGTFVNDARIEGVTPLRLGDVLRVGRTSLGVEAGHAPATPPPPPPIGEGTTPTPLPAAYAAPALAPSAASLTTAAIVLTLVGLASAGYNGWDLTLVIGDLEILEQVGFGWLGNTLLAIDVVLILSGVLMLIAGIRLLATRQAGRGLGLAGVAGTLIGWAAFLGVAASEGFLSGINALAWAMLVISVAGSVVAGILLLTGGRPARI
jgi:hypothetical protein